MRTGEDNGCPQNLFGDCNEESTTDVENDPLLTEPFQVLMSEYNAVIHLS